MNPLVERLRSRDVVAPVTLETVDLLVDRFLGILGGQGERTLTVLQQYRYKNGTDPMSKQGLWNLGYGAKTGLRVGGDEWADWITRKNGVDRWSQKTPLGRGVTVYLEPGIESVGFGVHDMGYNREWATSEEAAWAYYRDDTKQREEITLVHLDGFAGEPTRHDRLMIEDWNRHGVCSETLILFNA